MRLLILCPVTGDDDPFRFMTEQIFGHHRVSVYARRRHARRRHARRFQAHRRSPPCRNALHHCPQTPLLTVLAVCACVDDHSGRVSWTAAMTAVRAHLWTVGPRRGTQR
eukprot:COSAG04_NODE_2330_length_4324_cov_2.131124_5_plen_109_part_00